MWAAQNVLQIWVQIIHVHALGMASALQTPHVIATLHNSWTPMVSLHMAHLQLLLLISVGEGLTAQSHVFAALILTTGQYAGETSAFDMHVFYNILLALNCATQF